MNTPLTAEEEVRMERLAEARTEADRRVHKLRAEATEAIRAKNAAEKAAKKIGADWLVLAERKYGK